MDREAGGDRVMDLVGGDTAVELEDKVREKAWEDREVEKDEALQND